MARQDIIRVKAVFELPYDKKKWGETAKAEGTIENLQEKIEAEAKDLGVTVVSFVPQLTSIEGS